MIVPEGWGPMRTIGRVRFRVGLDPEAWVYERPDRYAVQIRIRGRRWFVASRGKTIAEAARLAVVKARRVIAGDGRLTVFNTPEGIA